MRSKHLGSLIAPLVLVIGLSAVSAADPLIDAVKKGDKTAIRTVLQRAEVNAAAPDGTTALHLAAQSNDLAAADHRSERRRPARRPEAGERRRSRRGGRWPAPAMVQAEHL